MFQTSQPGPAVHGWQSKYQAVEPEGVTRVLVDHRDYLTAMGYISFNSKLVFMAARKLMESRTVFMLAVLAKAQVKSRQP